MIDRANLIDAIYAAIIGGLFLAGWYYRDIPIVTVPVLAGACTLFTWRLTRIPQHEMDN